MVCPRVDPKNQPECLNWIKRLVDFNLPIKVRSVAIQELAPGTVPDSVWHANCDTGPVGSKFEAKRSNIEQVRPVLQSLLSESAKVGVLKAGTIWAPGQTPIWQFSFHPKQ